MFIFSVYLNAVNSPCVYIAQSSLQEREVAHQFVSEVFAGAAMRFQSQPLYSSSKPNAAVSRHFCVVSHPFLYWHMHGSGVSSWLSVSSRKYLLRRICTYVYVFVSVPTTW